MVFHVQETRGIPRDVPGIPSERRHNLPSAPCDIGVLNHDASDHHVLKTSTFFRLGDLVLDLFMGLRGRGVQQCTYMYISCVRI